MDTLNRIAMKRGPPATIKVDNGNRFISKAMDKWRYECVIEIELRPLGKPTDKSFPF